VVIGETGADIGAARAAGAQAVMVPNTVTRVEEIAAAPVVSSSFPEDVRLVLAARSRPPGRQCRGGC